MSNIDNENLIKQFGLLINQINSDIDNATDFNKKKIDLFRLKQISHALEVIKKFKKTITSSEQLADIKGIGAGIKGRIDEILQTGKLKEIKIKPKNVNRTKYIENLKEVYGIGEKKAIELVDEFKIKNIDDLKKAVETGEVKLNNNVLIGLKYVDLYQQKIPRSEMTKMSNRLQIISKQISKKLIITVCGSYRRERPFSNDIDCLLVHPNVRTHDDLLNKTNYLHKLIETLKENNFIIDALTGENVETKFMGFCQLSEKYPVRRIDIRYMPYESYYSALLYFTGSGSFNQDMRHIAKRLDYKLNEYGLFKKNNDEYDKVEISSEENIFDILGMEYVEPKNRL